MDIGVYMRPDVLAHKLEAQDEKNPEEAWNLGRWPKVLSEKGEHRLFVACNECECSHCCSQAPWGGGGGRWSEPRIHAGFGLASFGRGAKLASEYRDGRSAPASRAPNQADARRSRSGAQ